MTRNRHEVSNLGFRYWLSAAKQLWHGESCVYCGSFLPRSTVDHVMPRAMGTFNQSWTLDSVCDSCNNFFSQLEIHLGRDSVEAVRRIDHGVKSPESAKDLRYRRLKATVIESKHEGLRVAMAPSGDDIVPVPVPQVGFRIPGQAQWTFLTLPELTPDRVIPYKARATVEMQVVAPSGNGFNELLERLAQLGIPFVQQYQTLNQNMHDEDTPLQVEFLVNIDTDLRRAASKIGFNYATKLLGANTMRSRAFDASREFIRHGYESEFLSTVEDRPALFGSGTEGRHICALVWTEQGLIAIICLLNHLTYKLRLCPPHYFEFALVRHHHVFDPIDHAIYEIPADRFNVAPVRRS